MEITKKQWMIIGVVIAIIAVWYFFLRKKKAPESNYRRTPPYKRPLFATAATGTGTVGTVGAGGIGVVGGTAVARYHCDWKNPKTGQVTTVEGPCPPAKANQGWVTIFD